MLLSEILRQKRAIISDQLNEPNQLFTFLNPVSYLVARKRVGLYSAFDYKLPDGWLYAAVLSLVLKIKAPRYSFDMTSLAPLVFKKAIEKNQSIYFIGARSEEINSFIVTIKNHFPDLNIIGYRNGFFNDSEERSNLITNVLNLSPDIVIAGLGVPLQEHFLVDLRKSGWLGCGYTCGGFIHQTTLKLNYYPGWINSLHLRMPYRFLKESHFRKRLPDYFKFIFIFVYDYIKYKSNQKFHT